MSESSIAAFPKWMRDICQLLPIRAQFVLSGNIRDNVLVDDGSGRNDMLSLHETIWRALQAQGFAGLLLWDIVDGLRRYPATTSELLNEIADKNLDKPQAIKFAELNRLLRRVAQNNRAGGAVALIIDFTTRLSAEQDDVRKFYISAEKAAQEAIRRSAHDMGGAVFNPIIWLANRPSALPNWLTVDNERIRSLVIPMPDADSRTRLARNLYGELSSRETDADAFAKLFTSLTHNMTFNAMRDIVNLAQQQQIAADDIDDAVQRYRVGDVSLQSPWRSEQLRQSILDAENSSEPGKQLGQRIMGQPKAVMHVLDILKRTSYGLTGAHVSAASSASRPRGVLFFAGPTGVGKTEMAKGIAQIVFGDERAVKRFDMSEFSAEHSGDRLIGAPPGYVGFDQGGELTNAMRESPFRVLLFDEIEKAHDRILDKFLQILEDGRLTDGRGETVYFSDSLIIFTSNVGISRTQPDGTVEILINPDTPPGEFETKLMEGIRWHFERKLQRPELLNRIGENIVMFHYIEPEVADAILETMIGKVKNRLEEEHGIRLELVPSVRLRLSELCARGNIENGGRGIGSKLEDVFINPLARLLFETNLPAGSTLRISRLTEHDGMYELAGD